MRTYFIILACIIAGMFAITLIALWAVLVFHLVDMFQDYLEDRWE